LEFILFTTNNQLRFRVARANKILIELSNLKMVVDGVDLSRNSATRRIEPYKVQETYRTRGVHAVATNHCLGARISVRHAVTKADYVLEIRVYNDGVAFRHFIPGSGERIPDEGTTFVVPDGSTAWFHDFEGHYEGVHQQKKIAEVKQGEWAAPPLTIKFPGNAGYAAITEAGLMNYAGMGLQADGQRGFTTVLGHALPVSYPFDLRFGKDEAKRLSQPAAIDGPITTPWRVITIGPDLNTLVNCDLIENLSPAADRTLFPAGADTGWVRPGRAVWRYLDGGDNTLAGIREFSRLAGLLGFEHNVIEGLWHRWSDDEIRELVEYSNQRRVGLWFWEHSKNLHTPAQRDAFFKRLNDLGVVGAKIDFFDHEAKEIIDLYQALLRSSAEHRIMVEFHGSNKPAGEARTWPHELSRESVRGMETRSMQRWAVHNTTLPFTRFLAGHADYTPVLFGERRRETSWAHQIATAVVFTSPLMIYGAHPQSILDNPAVEVIKHIPTVWDETTVLPPSEIGVLAVFARRRGDDWWVGVLNADAEKNVRVPLSFLAGGNYRATLVRDQKEKSDAVKMERVSVTRRTQLTVDLRAGGGFVGWFTR
jgi:alpha-glucosidase